MLRWGSIGTSSIVELFAAAIAQVDGAAYTVVQSRDTVRGEQFARANGAARAVGSVQALAEARDVDAVYVASPNALHHQQAAALLQAGKHVLVEKSACANSQEWASLLELARAHDVVLLESVRSVFDPSWRAVTSYLDSLGPVRQVNLQMCQRSRRYDNFLAGHVENIFKPELAAGALMDLGVYCLHPLVTLFGAPNSVQASSVLLRNGIDGATTLLLGYDGFTATVTCSKVSANGAPSVIAGEDASLVIDAIADPQRVWTRCARSGGDEEPVVFTKPLPQQAYVLQAFAEMVAEPGLATGHQQATTDALAVMDQARRQVGLRFDADRW